MKSNPRRQHVPVQIRSYRPADHDRLYQICLLTGADGADASDRFADPDLLGEVYVGPYLALAPDLAWVLDDGKRAIGYVLGAADTPEFEAECETRWWPGARARHPLGSAPPGTADAEIVGLIHHPETSPLEVVARYPAHLHIDLLPAGQGAGHGRALLYTLFAELRRRQVPGVHLGVSPDNTRAIGFYRHLGFQPLVDDEETLLGLEL